MNESIHNSPEQGPRREDAAWLAKLYYYTADRVNKIDEVELGEVREDIGSYCRFRAVQDPEMGRAIIHAFESFQDPDPEAALPETADDMRREADWIRQALGLPPADTLNVPPPSRS